MPPTIGHQTIARYILEDAEGAGIPNAGVLKLFSDALQDVRKRITANQEALYSTSKADPVGFVRGVIEHGLTLRWRWQDHADAYTLIQDLCTRQANGRLKTLAIELGFGIDGATPSWFTCKGCKASEIRVNVDEDGLYVVEADVMPLDVDAASAMPALPGTTTRQTTPIGTAYFPFTGGKFETPEGVAIAFATKSGGFTVRHNLTPIKGAGTGTVKSYAEGRREVLYQGDITVDDGGKALHDAVADGTTVNVAVFLSAAAGKPKVTIAATPLAEVEIGGDDSGDYLTATVERQGTGITFGAV